MPLDIAKIRLWNMIFETGFGVKLSNHLLTCCLLHVLGYVFGNANAKPLNLASEEYAPYLHPDLPLRAGLGSLCQSLHHKVVMKRVLSLSLGSGSGKFKA